MFAYINPSNDLTLDMVRQYKNSLILLGDEKQFFNPLTNSYVGIGMTAYNNLLSAIQSGSDKTTALDAHLHQNTVNSIHANFAPSELRPKVPTSADILHLDGHDVGLYNYEYELLANKDVVLKGVHDYDPSTKLGMTIDELGNAITNPTTYGSSGITVNINHNGGTWHHGVDEEGFEYGYWSAQDTITIDDKLTWAYITNQSSYIMDFAKSMAVSQANRVYKDILGTDIVYIEKEFNEAFLYDQYQNKLEEINQVYVKYSDGSYVAVNVIEDNGHWYIVSEDHPTDVLYSDTNTAPTGYTMLSSASIASRLSSNGGYEDQDGTNVPVWYHVDIEHTASTNKTIADGIQTIKEISYILDVLTDGSEDDGIQLAYNISYNFVEIQKLKEWQSNLGTNTVNSFQTESLNRLVTVSYYSSNLWDATKDKAAVGDVKLDIDLILAQTYMDGENKVHAAYLSGGTPIYRYIKHADPTNTANYVLITSSNYVNLTNQLTEVGYESGVSSISFYVYNSAEGKYVLSSTGIFSQAELQARTGDYIYFPYTKTEADVTQGLTTVEWVTSYVAWGVQDILEQVQGVNDDIKEYIDDIIAGLDASDNEVEGQYVSSVSEENGIITVTRKALPLDVILNNEIKYSDDIYLNINGQEAYQLMTDNPARTDIYILQSGSLQLVTSVNGIDQTSHGTYYIKRNLSKFIEVQSTTPITQLLVGVNNNCSYYVKTTGAAGRVQYTPIDLVYENRRQVYFDSNGQVLNNEEIYWLDVTSTKSKKYLDTRYVQHKDGHTDMYVSAYVMNLQEASPDNTGLADAWNVRQTLEAMFAWVDLKTNKVII